MSWYLVLIPPRAAGCCLAAGFDQWSGGCERGAFWRTVAADYTFCTLQAAVVLLALTSLSCLAVVRGDLWILC
jgi:hypothetical protein